MAERLRLRPPETEFDRGIRRFGYLLTSAMLVMVLLVFVAHALRGRPPVDTLLFSVALAVGLSPELLPAILSVNLARGAQMMASIPFGRMGRPEEIGEMVLFLCSERSSYVSGACYNVDGGYMAI